MQTHCKAIWGIIFYVLCITYTAAIDISEGQIEFGHERWQKEYVQWFDKEPQGQVIYVLTFSEYQRLAPPDSQVQLVASLKGGGLTACPTGFWFSISQFPVPKSGSMWVEFLDVQDGGVLEVILDGKKVWSKTISRRNWLIETPIISVEAGEDKNISLQIKVGEPNSKFPQGGIASFAIIESIDSEKSVLKEKTTMESYSTPKKMSKDQGKPVVVKSSRSKEDISKATEAIKEVLSREFIWWFNGTKKVLQKLSPTNFARYQIEK